MVEECLTCHVTMDLVDNGSNLKALVSPCDAAGSHNLSVGSGFVASTGVGGHGSAASKSFAAATTRSRVAASGASGGVFARAGASVAIRSGEIKRG
ncbi:hypothetical protein SUGI_0780330 [Cryptomeria japonica]|nr:hypothetical protein SUGI_0780330 [Cryptomeria japonica]